MKKSRSKQKNGIGRSILTGVILAVVISVVIAAFMGILVINKRFNYEYVKYITPVVQFISSVACGVVAGKIVGQKYAVIISGAVAGYCFVLAAITVFVFGSDFGRVGLSILMCALGAVVSCLLCTIKRTKHKFKQSAL